MTSAPWVMYGNSRVSANQSRNPDPMCIMVLICMARNLRQNGLRGQIANRGTRSIGCKRARSCLSMALEITMRRNEMAKFIIQPHGRLNDWVADEKGYFAEEGLDYELNVEGSRKSTPRLAAVDLPSPLEDNRFGAYERYAEGHGRKGEGAGDVSCACHWTVNQAARDDEGIMWGKAYSVCEAAIVVPAESKISEPS